MLVLSFPSFAIPSTTHSLSPTLISFSLSPSLLTSVFPISSADAQLSSTRARCNFPRPRHFSARSSSPRSRQSHPSRYPYHHSSSCSSSCILPRHSAGLRTTERGGTRRCSARAGCGRGRSWRTAESCPSSLTQVRLSCLLFFPSFLDTFVSLPYTCLYHESSARVGRERRCLCGAGVCAVSHTLRRRLTLLCRLSSSIALLALYTLPFKAAFACETR